MPHGGSRVELFVPVCRRSIASPCVRICLLRSDSAKVVHRSLRCIAMPTVNPRINVTLSPQLDLVVQRLATFQRVSKSQVLRELLEAAEPALQRAVVLMEAAAGAADAMKEGFAQSLDRAQSKVEAHAAAVLRQMDQTSLDLVQQAEAIRGRRPRASKAQPSRVASPPGTGSPSAPRPRGASPNPPASNRGVKSTKRVVVRATIPGKKS